jgi:hypothetical protein
MEVELASPSHEQAKALRALSEQGGLTYQEIHREMKAEKPNQKNYAKIHPNIWQEYFRSDATASEIERCVSKALKIEKSIGKLFADDPTPEQLESFHGNPNSQTHGASGMSNFATTPAKTGDRAEISNFT